MRAILDTTRHVLRQLQATEFHTSSHVFFQRSQPTGALVKLLKKLDILLPSTILSVNPLQSPAQDTLGTRLFLLSPDIPCQKYLHVCMRT